MNDRIEAAAWPGRVFCQRKNTAIGGHFNFTAPQSPRIATGIDHTLRLDLAFAVAEPGRPAILLDATNKKDGKPIPIRQAVASSRAFTIELALHVLGIDLDDAAKLRVFRKFVAELQAHNIIPVIVDSGRPGHKHLFASIPDGELRNRITARARALGLSVSASMRPPLTPHRQGLPVRLLSPHDPTEALRALTPPTRRELHPRIANLLRHGDTEGRYRTKDGDPDRSAILAAIVTSAINRGWSREETHRVCRNSKNKGGAKLQERKRKHGDLATRRYFKKLWNDQMRFCRTKAPLRISPAVMERLDSIVLAATRSLPWKMRGHSIWATLVACTMIAMESGALIFRASHRQIADRSALSRDTVNRTLNWLRLNGWLQLLRVGIGQHGSTWQLTLPTAIPATSNPGAKHPGGVLGLLAAGVTFGHDAFRWRAFERSGLGKGALRMLVLITSRPGTVEKMSEYLGIPVRAVQRMFKKLGAAGVITQGKPSRVHRAARTNPETVAVKLGTLGAAEAQRIHHTREREEYIGRYEYRRSQHRRQRSIERNRTTRDPGASVRVEPTVDALPDTSWILSGLEDVLPEDLGSEDPDLRDFAHYQEFVRTTQQTIDRQQLPPYRKVANENVTTYHWNR